MSLATFSNELKIFNGDESFSLSASAALCKAPGSFGRIAWSGDSHWLAVAPIQDSSDPFPVFKYRDNELVPLKYVTLTSVRSASFFNWTNRNIVVGVETGQIYVWDIKDKKITVKVDIEQKHSVDHICVNSDDILLASGSLNTSKICVHSLKTNKVVHTFAIPKSEHTSSLSFCVCKKSYLAASSYESTICVWDVVKSDIVFKALNSHSGSCTDISFSPINYSVLASVGLTKQLKLYDLREKKTIFEIAMSDPMHSVEMISNGDKVVVGASSGSVIMYDLRADKIYSEFKAHEGPVLSVKMQIMKDPQSYHEVEMNTPDIIESRSKTLDLSVMDVFSPICRSSQNTSVYSLKAVSFHSTPRVILSDSESVAPYNDSFLSKVLSPKREHILMSTPVEQLSSLKKKNEFTNSIKLGTVEEEPVDLKETSVQFDEKNDIVAGDGRHVYQSLSDSCLQNFLTEIKKIHNEQQDSIRKLSEKITSVERELQVMRLDNEGKYQILQENYENLVDVLISGIKQEIYSGNCDGKLEHICQRHLINNLSNLVSEKTDKVINEIGKYVQKINSVHKILSDIRK